MQRRRAIASALELTPSIVVLLVLAEALFGITTMFGPVQGVFTGILLQAAFVTNRNRDTTLPAASVER